MKNTIKICLLILMAVIILGFVGFILYDNSNSHKINDDLKSELYEAKKEISNLREEKNKARSDADKWYENYIDLGIQCGANE